MIQLITGLQITTFFKLYYHRSVNDMGQGAGKTVIIAKWKFCCIWDNGQDFANFETFLCQGMSFDTKTWICYYKGVLAPIILAISNFFHKQTC